MRKLGITMAAILMVALTYAQTSNWGFDQSHSNVRFAVSHMVISEVEGNFSTYEGSVSTTKSDFSDASVNFTINVSSIYTDDEKRDEHLRGADFFDVEKNPNITFKSTSIKKVSENKYKITGNFTMLGVTKEITLDAKYGGTINDPWGNTKAGIKVTGTINRTDWGLKYNSKMDTGGLMIGEDVDIVCNFELIKLK
ncbi:MAG: YceI family protein [Bacteroidetes bacterium]|nr:YceI family protein [Bacteroidota bacterium]